MIPPMLDLGQCFQLMGALKSVGKNKTITRYNLTTYEEKSETISSTNVLKKIRVSYNGAWPQYQMLLNTQYMFSIILSLGHFRPLKKSRQSFHLWP